MMNEKVIRHLSLPTITTEYYDEKGHMYKNITRPKTDEEVIEDFRNILYSMKNADKHIEDWKKNNK